MKHIKISILIVIQLSFGLSNAQSLLTIDSLINNGNYLMAKSILDDKYKKGDISFEEFIRFFLLSEFLGFETNINDARKFIYQSENPYPYIEAFKFTEPFLGSYGIKKDHQLKLIETLLKDKGCPVGLKPSLYYHLNFNYYFTHKFDKIKENKQNIGSISKWLLAGTFNNISGSGMNKVLDPEIYASSDAEFNTDYGQLKWIQAQESSYDGWVSFTNQLTYRNSSIYYAQTFIQSDTEKEIILGIGYTGMIKVFLNDAEIYCNIKERMTDFDAVCLQVKLLSGYNRLLVKIGTEKRDYPSFAIRIFDTDSNLLTPQLEYHTTYKPYQKSTFSKNHKMSLLSDKEEQYLLNKIKQHPNDWCSQIVLARYYVRKSKYYEAIKIIEDAYKHYPKNPIVLLNRVHCYEEANNYVKLSEGFQELISIYPESYSSLYYKFLQNYNAKEYNKSLEILNEIAKKYGLKDYLVIEKIKILAKLNLYDDMIKEIYTAYQTLPSVKSIVELYGRVKKDVEKQPKEAIKVYENFLKKYYSNTILDLLIETYNQQNQSHKSEKLLLKYYKIFPYDAEFIKKMYYFYFTTQQYNQSLYYAKKALNIKPFDYEILQDIGYIFEGLNNKDSAIFYFKRSLTFNPNRYSILKRIRVLEGKPDLFDLVENTTVDNTFVEKFKHIAQGQFAFLLDEKTHVLYPNGGHEELHNVAIKILSQDAIEKFKELSLSSTQTEDNIIIDAFLLKNNGKKINPEIYDDNRIIWSTIEIGDVIYLKYKTRYYYEGKFMKDFYEIIYFGDDDPSFNQRYSVIFPKNRKLYMKTFNPSPLVKMDSIEIDDYKIYTWKCDSTPLIFNEPYMPSIGELATSVIVSTMNSWESISNWYADLTYSKFEYDDVEIEDAFHNIFANINLNETTVLQKAKMIYNYIQNNISYLSTPIRQSNVIPQRASITLQTKLGDCKDLSVLFLTLAHKAGINGNLVLVRTKEKGQKDYELPNFVFDHCIVKIYDENQKEYFIELTDKELPFLHLPKDVYRALALDVIPDKKINTCKPYFINPSTRKKDFHINNISATLDELGNLKIKHEYKIKGNRFYYKNEFLSLSSEEVKSNYQKKLSDKFGVPVTLHALNVDTIKLHQDTFKIIYSYTLNNYAKPINNQSILQLPFYFTYFGTSLLSNEKINYDICYDDYEDIDTVYENITIILPNPKAFNTFPKNTTLTFNQSICDVKFTKLNPQTLIVTRKIKINRDKIPANLYEQFKDYIQKNIKLEKTLISFNE